MVAPIRKLMSSLLPATARRSATVSASLSTQLSQLSSSASAEAIYGDDLDIDGLKGRSYFYQDQFSYNPVTILRKALKAYLPDKPKFGNFEPDWLPLGFQHVFFRPDLLPDELCDDGTDTKFLPGPKDIWKYRLWAGGSVVSHHRIPFNTQNGSVGSLLERASDVRVVADNGKAKRVFVTIERKVAVLRKFDTIDERTGIPSEPGPLTQDKSLHLLTETENICFLREPPSSLQDERRVRPPTKPAYSFTTIPKRSLLFQFSALTYNAHNIHLDRQLAQQEYGAKDLVVHGPLTQVMMIEFLERYLSRIWSDKNIIAVPKAINYTNVSPLFVDQPLTLCCRPTSEFENSPNHQITSWNVWIQKGEGDGGSLAVKATIHVDALSHDCFPVGN